MMKTIDCNLDLDEVQQQQQQQWENMMRIRVVTTTGTSVLAGTMFQMLINKLPLTVLYVRNV